MIRRRRLSIRWTDKGCTLVLALRTPSGQYAGERLVPIPPNPADDLSTASGTEAPAPPPGRLH